MYPIITDTGEVSGRSLGLDTGFIDSTDKELYLITYSVNMNYV